MKHKLHLSKTVCLCVCARVFVCACRGRWFSIFDFVSFLLMSIFLFNKKHGLFDFKMSFSFKIKNNKSHAQLCSQTYDS